MWYLSRKDMMLNRLCWLELLWNMGQQIHTSTWHTGWTFHFREGIPTLDNYKSDGLLYIYSLPCNLFLPSTRSSMSNALAPVCDESWRSDTQQFGCTLPDSPQPYLSSDSLSEWKHQNDRRNPLTNTRKIAKPHLSGEGNLCYSLTRESKALGVFGNRRGMLHKQSLDQVKACSSWSLGECWYILYAL